MIKMSSDSIKGLSFSLFSVFNPTVQALSQPEISEGHHVRVGGATAPPCCMHLNGPGGNDA